MSESILERWRRRWLTAATAAAPTPGPVAAPVPARMPIDIEEILTREFPLDYPVAALAVVLGGALLRRSRRARRHST